MHIIQEKGINASYKRNHHPSIIISNQFASDYSGKLESLGSTSSTYTVYGAPRRDSHFHGVRWLAE